MAGRPWLFLDVDGVVAPLRRVDRSTGMPVTAGTGRLDPVVPAGYRTWPGAVYGLYVPEDLTEWAELLDGLFEVRWCTSWEHHAPELVARPAGLPEWPSLGLDAGRDGRGRVAAKAAAIGKVLADNPAPFAWADDHLDRPGRLPPALARLGLPHLLIRPSLAVGLTATHIDKLTAFAHAHPPSRRPRC